MIGLPKILQAQILSRFHDAIGRVGLHLLLAQTGTDNIYKNAYSRFKLDMMRLWENRINFCRTVMDHIL